MGTLGGIALIIGITLVAGLIAYVGDRVGHQVGRKRMTLFGLRPKYTSTIVAVATGMTIALVATIVTLSTSPYARAAFFHLSEINNRVNLLQAQADDLERVRNSNIVIGRGDVVYNQFLVVTPQQTPAQRLKVLQVFFDTVVASLDKRFVPLGLKPFVGKSSDPEIATKLQTVLDDQTTQGFLLRGPVLLVAVADENLFANDRLHFTLLPYADQPIFRSGAPITSVEVDGGTAILPNVAYGQLATAIREFAIQSGMPSFFANVVFSSLSTAQVQATRRAILAGKGRFYIVARASTDIFPHTGDIPVNFELARTPK